MSVRKSMTPEQAMRDRNFGAWVLICNPRYFDPSKVISDGIIDTAWTTSARNRSRTTLMRPGHPVLLWMTGGSSHYAKGFWGAGKLTSSVHIGDFQYAPEWTKELNAEEEAYVEVDLPVFSSPTRASSLSGDQVFENIEPLRAFRANPAFLTYKELERLNQQFESPLQNLEAKSLPLDWQPPTRTHPDIVAHRRKTEHIALDAVRLHYERQQYVVSDVSAAKVGYDMRCITKAGQSAHVEVKGLSASSPFVNITRNEIIKSADVPEWILGIVTDAHNPCARMVRFYSSQKVRDVLPVDWDPATAKYVRMNFIGVKPDVEYHEPSVLDHTS